MPGQQVPPSRHPFEGHFGHGFGRSRRAKRGDVRAAVLSLLAEQPRNGYQIIQEIAERSEGAWRPSPGSVYPALQQLEDEGLVEAGEGERRKVFQLTGEGRTYVDEHQDELAAPWEAASCDVGEDMVELRNLMMQLGMATMQVGQAGTTHQIAEARNVLDDARRKLYRILAEDEPPESGQEGP